MLSFFKKNKPKFSFVVIAYNRKEYITECIDSILEQNIEKEIICIDDNSTDGTYEILKEYSKKHKEIKLFQNEQNMGTVYTRCIGLQKCTGEYMLFVDADDKVIGSFDILYNLAKNKNADILEFSCKTDGSEEFQKNLLRENKEINDNLLTAYHNKEIKNQLWNKIISEKLYKRVIKKIDTEVKQANFSDVVYFMYHFLLNAQKYVSTDNFGYFYYDQRGMTASISAEERLKQYCSFKVTKEALELVYGKMPELTDTWNYICNQAVVTYLSLSKEEQEKYKHFLYRLMSEKNANFLIKEISKLQK